MANRHGNSWRRSQCRGLHPLGGGHFENEPSHVSHVDQDPMSVRGTRPLDAGYTLAETLVGLAILSMSIGALASGIAVLATVQLNSNELLGKARSLRQATQALERPLNTFGPFRSSEPERFVGGPHSFQFDCKASELCRVELLSSPTSNAIRISDKQGVRKIPLRTPGDAHFTYTGTTSPEGAVWPPPNGVRQALRSVGIAIDAPGAPSRIQVVLSAEQPKICFFDPVMQDCR